MTLRCYLNSRTAASIGALALIYFFAGKFGLRLAFLHPSATAVWPPTGIALAALLIFGFHLWPGITIGALALNLATAGTFATSAGIAVGNTLEAVLGAWLVLRFASGRDAFSRAGAIFKYVLLAGLISTAVSATFGVTSLYRAGFAIKEDWLAIWLTWWLGDMTSNLVIAPLLFVWSANPRPELNPKQKLEACASILLSFCAAVVVFGGSIAFFNVYRLSFLCIPPVLWAAYRFGRHGAVTTVFLVSATAIWGTLSGFGPFASAQPNESLVLLQGFMGTIALTAAVLAAVTAERRQTEAALRISEQELHRLNRELEGRVQERTASLEKAHTELLRDIEERERLQAQLRQQERLSALGLATAKVVHEIANPLNSIALAAELLARRLEQSPTDIDAEASDLTMALRREISRLGSLLEDIRSFSMPNTKVMDMELTDVSALADELLERERAAYERRGIVIKKDFPSGLPRVMADNKKMTQVLLNLCKNAVEAMAEGGTLTVRAYRSGDGLCIEVADTGTGIPHDLDVFEPLMTTKPSGMGVGLPIVAQIVGAHGGNITYQSQMDKGTVFRILLPCA